MSREFKFRAWKKYHKKMVYGATPHPGGYVCLPWSIPLPVEEQTQFSGDKQHGYLEKKKIVLMQYTGLHDKNSVEIYEGDIISDVQGKLCPVLWDSENAKFAVNGGKIDMPGFHHGDKDFIMGITEWITKEWEVVGNIHENSVLMTSPSTPTLRGLEEVSE